MGAALRAALAAALAVAGAAALAVAEFLALYRVQAADHRVASSVTAGSHHGFALLPIAALAIVCAAAFGLAAGRRHSRAWAPAAALVALGIVVLGIALLADLPDIHRTGLLGTPQTGLHNARTVAGPALYLESAGAIALLAGGLAGLRTIPTRRPRRLQ